MAKITIKFNTAVIKELELTKKEYTIGRKPSNDIVLDNPAVSGFHGKILKDGDLFYIEDLNSTNGTFLNGQRIRKNQLRHKDQIGIARYMLEMALENAPAPAPTPPPSPTPIPPGPSAPALSVTSSPSQPAPGDKGSGASDPQKEAQLEILRQSLGLPPQTTAQEPAASSGPESSAPATPPAQVVVSGSLSKPPLSAELPVGNTPPPNPPTSALPPAVIKILGGAVNNQTEIKIKDLVTYIGTADQASIKIKGLLAPGLAAAISRRPDGYFLKAVKAGYPKVNGAPIQQQIYLENGALIEVGATNMVFYLVDPAKVQE